MVIQHLNLSSLKQQCYSEPSGGSRVQVSYPILKALPFEHHLRLSVGARSAVRDSATISAAAVLVIIVFYSQVKLDYDFANGLRP